MAGQTRATSKRTNTGLTTVGHQRYLQARATGLSQRKAAEQAGYRYNAGTVHRLERRLADTLTPIAKEENFTPRDLIHLLRAGLNAEQTVFYPLPDGTVKEVVEPDWRTRLMFAERVGELLDWYPAYTPLVTPALFGHLEIARVVMQFSALTDQELRELMTARGARLLTDSLKDSSTIS